MTDSHSGKRILPKVGIDAEHRIENIRVFALDMDGTIYLGDKWIDGAKEFLSRITQTGRKYIFLTNNSSKSPQAYVDKLSRMGFETNPDHIITSGQATIWYLKKHFLGKRVFLLGNDLLRAEFEAAGIEVTRSGSLEATQDKGSSVTDNRPGYDLAELVVTGFDTTLDYAKMCQVCDLVRKGLPYIATHPDYNCPTETGFIPDIGSIAAFIKASTGREPDVVVGKPNAPIAEYLLERARRLISKDINSCKDPDSEAVNICYKDGDKIKRIVTIGESSVIGFKDIAMVGDRLYTDVACGVSAGMTGILVLSGEAAMEDVAESDVIPDLIFKSVKDIVL